MANRLDSRIFAAVEPAASIFSSLGRVAARLRPGLAAAAGLTRILELLLERRERAATTAGLFGRRGRDSIGDPTR